MTCEVGLRSVEIWPLDILIYRGDCSIRVFRSFMIIYRLLLTVVQRD